MDRFAETSHFAADAVAAVAAGAVLGGARVPFLLLEGLDAVELSPKHGFGVAGAGACVKNHPS